MYTVFMRNNSTKYKSGFPTWANANAWGRANFGPNNFDIEQE